MNVQKQLAILASSVTLLALSPAVFASGDAEQGKKTFQQCVVCHNTDTEEKKVGPSLKGLFGRKKLTNGKSVSDANVLGQIDKGGGGMPAFGDKLTPEEKENLIAYLHTL